MIHIKNFKSFNEGLFNIFKNPISYREDMKVSKRMKENDIHQEFEKDSDSKKENKEITYLFWNEGREKRKVAKIQISDSDQYGRPLIDLFILDSNSEPISRKRFLNQESAIHHFLDYWEAKSKPGREKNKSYKLKKY